MTPPARLCRLTVSGQLQQLGGRRIAGPPKSDAGRRVIALDTTTITALREHRIRQRAERAAAGTRWTETGYAFTTVTGTPFRPDRMTRLFAKLVAASGLPPATLHGLRHGALLTVGRGLVGGQELLLVLRGELPSAGPLGHLRIGTLLVAGHRLARAAQNFDLLALVSPGP